MSVIPRTYDRPDAQKRTIEVKIGDKEFEFVEFQSREPSNTAIVHFPAFAIDGEKDAENLHYVMEQRYATLALKDYGEEYSHDALKKALEKAVRESGKSNVVLHGASFGAGVIYDLISDASDPDFAEANNIRGAILETPALGKSHFNKRIRSVPDSILISGGRKFSKAVSHLSGPDSAVAGYREPGREMNQNMIAELFREKTAGRKIHIPIHVVFAEHDHLVDNDEVLKTVRSQSSEVSFQTVPSTAKSLRHQIDYENTWKQERAVIEGFVGRIK